VRGANRPLAVASIPGPLLGPPAGIIPGVRIAVLSDIHSNLEALDAVLERARIEEAERLYVLGDSVGYGADPAGVIARLTELEDVSLIAGNHDLAAVGRFDPRWFNSVAAEAISWTSEQLPAAARALLEQLSPRTKGVDPLLVHGSVVDPVAEYVTNERVAVASFDAEAFDLCFFGHTHIPAMFTRGPGGVVRGTYLEDGVPVALASGVVRVMVNPGSVGQPRDGDTRASFLIWDTTAHAVTVIRVGYDIEGAQDKIRAAGLPGVLADRLSLGR